MPWIAPQPADVLSEFTPNELAQIKQASGGVDNTAAILGRVVAEIRDAIRSGANDLDETYLAADPGSPTLPLGLHGTAIDLTRWRLLISLPAVKQLQTKPREDAKDFAEKRLFAIAEGKYATEPPTAGLTDRGGSWDSENKMLMRLHPVSRPGNQMCPNPNRYANPAAPADETCVPVTTEGGAPTP